MNVFISQPFHGRTEEEIFEERSKIINDLGLQYETIIDQYHQPVNERRFGYLSNDILMLGEADLVVFAKGWESAKGCRIEFVMCKTYDIKHIFA